MIKVLHFVSTPAIWSGVMSVIMNYYKHIDRSKVQFDFLCFSRCSPEESYEREIEGLGGRVFFIEKPTPSVQSIQQLQHFFKIHQKEYLWIHNHEIYLSFLLRPLSLHYGINNFIVHCHATKYSDRIGPAIRNAIFCIPIRIMKCQRMACSFKAGKFLFGQKQFYTLHNAIDINKYAYNPFVRERLRKELNIESNFVIGHVGRFMPQKNHKFLIYVFNKMVHKYPEARLLLIGDGPLKKEIENMCFEMGLSSSVLFLGSRDNVYDFLQVMDVFVLPSHFEGIGISLLEAQASNLPGVASIFVPKEADVTEQIHFLPLKNEEWFHQLEELLWHPQNPQDRGLDNSKIFRQKNYDIVEESFRLQNFYLEI